MAGSLGTWDDFLDALPPALPPVRSDHHDREQINAAFEAPPQGYNMSTEIVKATDETRTVALKFISQVEKQCMAELGQGIQWSPLHRTLAQHVFIKSNAALKLAEAKRKQGAPIVWANINIAKFAIDTVHRVSLGLDALIPNHIHPIAYWNNALGKYDLDLQIGYAGLDFAHQTHAIDPPKKVIHKLVRDDDEFEPIWQDADNPIEGYRFKAGNPFKPGAIIGGFGYIVFDDPTKNRLVIVTQDDFRKSRNGKNNEFWGYMETQDKPEDPRWREEMLMKTVIRRVAKKIPLDPAKVNPVALLALREAGGGELEEMPEEPEPTRPQVTDEAKAMIDATFREDDPEPSPRPQDTPWEPAAPPARNIRKEQAADVKVKLSEAKKDAPAQATEPAQPSLMAADVTNGMTDDEKAAIEAAELAEAQAEADRAYAEANGEPLEDPFADQAEISRLHGVK